MHNVTTTMKINESESYVVLDHIAATYTSKPGDSGEPVFINHKNGTASMLGVIVGVSCIFDADGIQIDMRNSYGACDNQLNIFSSWENIARDLSIK